MKKSLNGRIMRTLAILILLVLASCNQSGDQVSHEHIYTCPMHPAVIADTPGACPVCGMDLVRRSAAGSDEKISEDVSKLLRSPDEVVISAINTIRPEFKSVPLYLDVVGTVTYDTRNIYSIPARVAGRIEKMFVKFKFQAVKKGQTIAEIYSPELVTAQRELLYLLENDNENDQLITGAKHRLELLGLSRTEVNAMAKRTTVAQTFPIYSPYAGYIISNEFGPPSAPNASNSGGQTEGMVEMRSESTSVFNAAASATLVREGDYITEGQTLVKLVNADALRIELDLVGAEAEIISEKDKVQLDFLNGNTVQASVDLVQPFFTKGQNFLKVRVHVKDIDLAIGQLVKARIHLKPRQALWVPREAVIDLGTKKVVFVKERELLKPRKVTTGSDAGKLIEVRTGLASSDEIAANAQYLVDSESFIKTEH
jgi:membrane fusion protein, copper/silver efflux system